MQKVVRIDIWSDVVCPFCYLGTRQLAVAVERFDHREYVALHQRAFELDPHAPTDNALALDELLASKYGMTLERARALNRRLEGDAASLGMSWSLDRARVTNTFDAHRLVALAEFQGRGDAMSERLFRAYFSEGQLISDHAVLNTLGCEVGVGGVEELWSGDAFAPEVRSDETVAHELGITGVPSMLVDGKFMIVGAQGSEHMLEVLQQAWSSPRG